MRHGGPAPAMGLQESVPELRLHLPAGRLLRLGHMSHVLALVLLGVDCVARAWRIQLATWTAGGRLSFSHAIRLNLYGEAASQLTPNRLGGEPARFLGLNEARLRPVTGIVAIGVEVACEWPVFLLVGAALFGYYVPDWRGPPPTQLHRPPAGGPLPAQILTPAALVPPHPRRALAPAGGRPPPA